MFISKLLRRRNKNETIKKNADAISYPELFVVVNGLIPLILLAYDARFYRLGPNPISNALHSTGVVSVVVLTMSLAVTPLCRWLRRPSWMAFRRPLGLMAFFYACAHVFIYVVFDQNLRIQQAWSELMSRRYLQIGAIAILLMLPLALTSSTGMMRRLGYRNWKRLHRLVYVAIIASIIHYFLQSKIDTRWPILFAIVIAVLFLARSLGTLARGRQEVRE